MMSYCFSKGYNVRKKSPHFNVSIIRISGHIVLKRRDDYEEASEASAWRLLAEVSLSEARFEEVKAYIFDAACLVHVTLSSLFCWSLCSIYPNMCDVLKGNVQLALDSLIN